MECAVLIQKDLGSTGFWKDAPREIILQHHGVEGDHILSLCFSEKMPSVVRESIKLFDELAFKNNFLFLYVSSESKTYMDGCEELFSYVGYDYGSFGVEPGRPYSSIMNEVLFGHVDALRVYSILLNEHLLFPDKATVEEYVRVHHELALKGEKVEWDEVLDVYQIWKRNDVVVS